MPHCDLVAKIWFCPTFRRPQAFDFQTPGFSIYFTNHHQVFLCFGPGRASREARRERPLRPVPALIRSGLRTAVARLPRKQEKGERHQEAVGEVRLSARLCGCVLFFFSRFSFPTHGNDEALHSVLRIRRSQSGSPAQGHDPELGEFKRGGFRATAGPRLARSGNTR